MTSGTENDLLAVWVAHDSDAYAFGRAGTALHYDGLSWQPIAELSALTTDNLVAVVGFDEPRELFVLAGNGTVFHFSNSWRELPPVPSTLPLATLAGRSRNEIVGVGIGEVWRFDGSSWTDLGPLPSPTPSLHAAWSGETGELYVVGEADNMQLTPATDGVVFRKTAAGWGEALFYSLGDTPLRAVWGSADDDVFVAGVSTNRPAAAAHYDGVGWSEIPVSHVSGSTIWGSGPNDVFVAGEAGIYHYDGTGVLNSSAWVRETPLAITAIAGSRAGNVLAVGPRGTILRYARPAE